MTTVLICGGRHFTDRKTFYRKMNRVLEIIGCDHVIHGDARGADRLADEWARMHCIPVTAFPANWYPNGKDGGMDFNAGTKRNTQMLVEGKPDLVVAFPGGSGTDNMVRKARAAGVRVIEVKAS